MPGCSWRGHLRGAHIHYCPVFLEGTPARGTYSLLLGVLGGETWDTYEGYIFISARVFLEGTPVMGTYGFYYCPVFLEGTPTMARFVLSYNELKIEGGFERAFVALFDQDVQTFTSLMLLNLDQLEKQLDKEEFQETGSINAFRSKEGKVDSSKALDASLVVLECSGTKSDKQDTSSSSGNYITHAVDADIRLVDNQMPFIEVQLTAQHNVLTNEQQHYVQSELIYAHICWKSNKAKIKREIEVLETINIELKHSVVKLLAENEKLHKENEHLKQTYKDLYNSIKKTRVQTKDHNNSLIAQINSKTVENADLKARIQEKVFANASLKNELRKLKGNNVDTKFAKPSILGKPVLQPLRN
ncbi:hypothetical protein Tco_0564676 [Tanacetum coccineum]